MKSKGFFVTLILMTATVYFFWFAKTGEKTLLETNVDRGLRAYVDLTRVNMQLLRKIVISYIASEGQTPKSLMRLGEERLRRGCALLASPDKAPGRTP